MSVDYRNKKDFTFTFSQSWAHIWHKIKDGKNINLAILFNLTKQISVSGIFSFRKEQSYKLMHSFAIPIK